MKNASQERTEARGELAKGVAKVLRNRGIWAEARAAYGGSAWFVWVARLRHNGSVLSEESYGYFVPSPELGGSNDPKVVAAKIQKLEAKLAKEWAKDNA